MNKKIRVLMVIPRFPPIKIGGAERQLQRLCPLLVKRGVSVTILTGRADRYDVPGIEEVDGYKILRIWEPAVTIRGKRRLNSYSFMINLGRYLLQFRNRYDIIHEHSAGTPAIVCQWAANTLKKPCITKVTGNGVEAGISDKPIFGKLLMKRFLRMENIVVTTKVIRDQCLNMGFQSEQLIEIPNGVSVSDLPSYQTRTELRRKLMGSSQLLIAS
jgi:glycosyltransferase involved in cell wall biosynthesis